MLASSATITVIVLSGCETSLRVQSFCDKSIVAPHRRSMGITHLAAVTGSRGKARREQIAATREHPVCTGTSGANPRTEAELGELLEMPGGILLEPELPEM